MRFDFAFCFGAVLGQRCSGFVIPNFYRLILNQTSQNLG